MSEVFTHFNRRAISADQAARRTSAAGMSGCERVVFDTEAARLIDIATNPGDVMIVRAAP